MERIGKLDSFPEVREHALTQANVQEMLQLAERLREESGGELDDAAILAVSEACCLPEEFVRVAVGRLPERRRHGLAHRVRNAFLSMHPDDRRYVMSGLLGALCALGVAIGTHMGDQYGLFGTFAILMIALGLWNIAISASSRTAAIAGGLFGAVFFISRSVFSMVLRSDDVISAAWLLPHVLGGALASLALHGIVSKHRRRFGLQDPAEERQRLLRQLVEIQDKLREGEQSMSFLSLDVVGSTKMKEVADPLNVEFTFNEYHRFVETATRRFGGRVHSTAGDGVICAFPTPQQAFQAARFVQTGLVELNTFRNKIGIPIRLRAGIHTGTVVAPADQDISKISFAHVIDVAAHLQKSSPPGGIAVSEEAARRIPGGAHAIGEHCVETQGVKGYVWQPKTLDLGIGIVSSQPTGQGANPPATPRRNDV